MTSVKIRPGPVRVGGVKGVDWSGDRLGHVERLDGGEGEDDEGGVVGGGLDGDRWC